MRDGALDEGSISVAWIQDLQFWFWSDVLKLRTEEITGSETHDTFSIFRTTLTVEAAASSESILIMERAGSKCHQMLDSAAEGRQPSKLSSTDVFHISMAVLAVWKTLLVGAIGILHACLTPTCLTAYPSSEQVAARV